MATQVTSPWPRCGWQVSLREKGATSKEREKLGGEAAVGACSFSTEISVDSWVDRCEPDMGPCVLSEVLAVSTGGPQSRDTPQPQALPEPDLGH